MYITQKMGKKKKKKKSVKLERVIISFIPLHTVFITSIKYSSIIHKNPQKVCHQVPSPQNLVKLESNLHNTIKLILDKN